MEREVEDPGTHVTVILPRRSYSPLLGRLLHDRTADKIAAVISRIPRSAATIVPYDVPSRVAVLQARQAASEGGEACQRREGGQGGQAAATETTECGRRAGGHGLKSSQPSEAMSPCGMSAEAGIATAHLPGEAPRPGRPSPPRATGGLARAASVPSLRSPRPGRSPSRASVRVVEIRPVERNSVLAVEINDQSGNLTAMFYGRSHIPGLVCGARVRFLGSVGIRDGQPVMINPAYELVAPGGE